MLAASTRPVRRRRGAGVLVERDGGLLAPAAWEGNVPSITLDILERLARAIGVVLSREPVELTTV